MRRRPGETQDGKAAASINDDKNATTDHLDEDDQDKMIRELQSEADRLQEELHWSFGVLCFAAMAVTGLVAVYVSFFSKQAWAKERVSGMQQTLLLWMHATAAISIHWQAKYTVSDPAQALLSWKLIVSIVATAGLLLFILQGRQQEDAAFDHHTLHTAFVIGNVTVITGAVLLRLDSKSTATALTDLQSSKYRFKSL